MHQAPIVFHPLLEADEQFSEPIVPRAGALDDPATGWMPSPARDTFTAMTEVDGVMPLADRGLDLREIVPLVQA